ncbi:hypothetical protein SAMN04489864_10167 [Pedobacter insulae]|uniref:Uncharacterized protein n=1 Tax=Pedobacter insulae TaxID=414048 RepID=A0A1I2SUH2_9SPHI|nr:hypothetical protein SAMN04489864_10167 [Pedobacter insulae]
MVLKIIEGVYKIIFNALGKKQVVNSGTHAIAGFLTGILALCFFLSIFLLFSYITDKRFYIQKEKGFLLLLIVIYLAGTHFLMFSVFKFNKLGSDENSLFLLDTEILRPSYILLYSTLIGSLALILFDIFFMSKN